MNSRTPARVRISDELLARLASRLTDRDRYLCRLLWEHQVLTTNQIHDIAFESRNATEHRLLVLYRHRVVDRFRPFRPIGSAPFHYVLDHMGAAVLAAERGQTVTELGYRRDKAIGIAHNQRLSHLVGVNGFFSSLAAAARRRPGASLEQWWSERRCRATWGAIVRPDGYGRWRETAAVIDFFLEYDNGTEPLRRLSEKLAGYAELFTATDLQTPILFWFPGPRREAEARRALAGSGLPITTANAKQHSPSEAVWLPVGETEPRLGLTKLPTTAEPSSSPHSRHTRPFAPFSRMNHRSTQG
jgi:hypothetical protein